MEKVIGYRMDELVGKKHFYELAPPEYRETVKNNGFTYMRQKRSFFNLENTIITKKGQLIRVLSSGIPLFDRNNQCIGYRGTDKDITELKKFQSNLEEIKQNLLENEARFSTLAENSTAGIFIMQDQRFILVNPALCEMLGYSENELKNIEYYKLIHPEYRNEVVERTNARLRGEKRPSLYKFHVITKTGEIRLFEVSTGVTSYNEKPAIIGTVFDITDIT